MTIYQFAVVGVLTIITASMILVVACIVAGVKFPCNSKGTLAWCMGYGVLGAFLCWLWNI